MELLRNPTVARAAKLYEELIKYAIRTGFESMNRSEAGRIVVNDETMEIFDRYCGFNEAYCSATVVSEK